MIDIIRSRYFNDGSDLQICVGPLVWEPRKNGGRYWYFVVAGSNRKRGFFIDRIQIKGDNKEALKEAIVSSIVLESVQKKIGSVIHSFEDELTLARMCEAIWPSDRTTRLRERVELEQSNTVGTA